ncbi:MAG TPA: transglycosylase SLT domain-containing protein [Syntrophobacteraceae bacterium]|nr:transglycosylase SLT domain-containing protein [Syntrophobacteraceae bacterium]
MKQHRFSRWFGYALVILFLAGTLFGCATTPPPTPSPTVTPPPTTSVKETLPLPAVPAPCPMAPYYPPPDRIDLCGEPVPLDVQDVQERFDREFTLIVYNHAQVFLWLKRMERYFPWIEERLRTYSLPEDLKYVAIVESDLLPNACSPKGAAGPWQFMPSTGTAYGLSQEGSCDRRYDFERSTDSAFRLLRDLYGRHKNWALALAAYNCGDRRIYDEMRNQRVTDYYHLRLPLETERYVMRILAVKAVLGNPAQYGYVLPKGLGYPELNLDRVPVRLSSPASIQNVAAAAGITYREFKRLNPEFRADDIPAGTHELKFPAGKGKTFEREFTPARMTSSPPVVSSQEEPDKTAESAPPEVSSVPSATPQAKPAATHTVKKGETLSGIAQRYKVSVKELREANNLRGSSVTAGQKLRIP